LGEQAEASVDNLLQRSRAFLFRGREYHGRFSPWMKRSMDSARYRGRTYRNKDTMGVSPWIFIDSNAESGLLKTIDKF
jgi:hypothetical protein